MPSDYSPDYFNATMQLMENGMTNQELCTEGQSALHTLERVAHEARRRAVATSDADAIIAADRFLAGIIDSHADALALCAFDAAIQPNFGGK